MKKDLDENSVRIIKISKEALFEFILCVHKSEDSKGNISRFYSRNDIIWRWR